MQSSDWKAAIGLAVLIAGAMSVGFFAAQRSRLSNRVFLILGTLPSLFIYLANPLHRVYSLHGFVHLGIVYRILTSGVPPDNPAFCGAPLLYPWSYHLVSAGLTRAFDISPAWAFAAVNLLCLVAALILLYRVAEDLLGDPPAARLAVLLSLYGLGFASTLHWNRAVLEHLGVFLEFRGLPPAVYFTDINATSAGLAFYSLFLLSLTRALASPPGRRRSVALVGLTAALTGAGFFYPFHFSAAVICAVAACGWLGVAKRVRVADAARVLGAALAPAVLVAPYLYSLVAAKAGGAEIRLAPSVAYAMANLGRSLAMLGPLALVMFAERPALGRLWRERPIESRVLSAALLVPSVLYVLVGAPFGTEYKFQTLTVLALGLPGAAAIAALAQSRPWIALLVVTSFLVPLGSDIVFEAIQPWAVTDPFVEDGVTIHHADPEQEALYDWIRAQSSTNAVFIDLRRTVPVFGQRALYVALDSLRSDAAAGAVDGWKFSAEQVLKGIHGYPADEVDRRTRAALAFYAPGDDPVGEELLATIAKDISGRPLYVVARDPQARRRLGADTRFQTVFDGRAAAVYLWGRGRSASATSARSSASRSPESQAQPR